MTKEQIRQQKRRELLLNNLRGIFQSGTLELMEEFFDGKVEAIIQNPNQPNVTLRDDIRSPQLAVSDEAVSELGLALEFFKYIKLPAVNANDKGKALINNGDGTVSSQKQTVGDFLHDVVFCDTKAKVDLANAKVPQPVPLATLNDLVFEFKTENSFMSVSIPLDDLKDSYYEVDTQSLEDGLTPKKGDFLYRSDLKSLFFYNGTIWIPTATEKFSFENEIDEDDFAIIKKTDTGYRNEVLNKEFSELKQVGVSYGIRGLRSPISNGFSTGLMGQDGAMRDHTGGGVHMSRINFDFNESKFLYISSASFYNRNTTKANDRKITIRIKATCDELGNLTFQRAKKENGDIKTAPAYSPPNILEVGWDSPETGEWEYSSEDFVEAIPAMFFDQKPYFGDNKNKPIVFDLEKNVSVIKDKDVDKIPNDYKYNTYESLTVDLPNLTKNQIVSVGTDPNTENNGVYLTIGDVDNPTDDIVTDIIKINETKEKEIITYTYKVEEAFTQIYSTGFMGGEVGVQVRLEEDPNGVDGITEFTINEGKSKVLYYISFGWNDQVGRRINNGNAYGIKMTVTAGENGVLSIDPVINNLGDLPNQYQKIGTANGFNNTLSWNSNLFGDTNNGVDNPITVNPATFSLVKASTNKKDIIEGLEVGSSYILSKTELGVIAQKVFSENNVSNDANKFLKVNAQATGIELTDFTVFGLYRGSSNTFDTLPTGNNKDIAVLNVADSTNLKGIYVSDGTDYSLLTEIKDVDLTNKVDLTVYNDAKTIQDALIASKVSQSDYETKQDSQDAEIVKKVNTDDFNSLQAIQDVVIEGKVDKNFLPSDATKTVVVNAGGTGFDYVKTYAIATYIRALDDVNLSHEKLATEKAVRLLNEEKLSSTISNIYVIVTDDTRQKLTGDSDSKISAIEIENLVDTGFEGTPPSWLSEGDLYIEYGTSNPSGNQFVRMPKASVNLNTRDNIRTLNTLNTIIENEDFLINEKGLREEFNKYILSPQSANDANKKIVVAPDGNGVVYVEEEKLVHSFNTLAELNAQYPNLNKNIMCIVGTDTNSENNGTYITLGDTTNLNNKKAIGILKV